MNPTANTILTRCTFCNVFISPRFYVFGQINELVPKLSVKKHSEATNFMSFYLKAHKRNVLCGFLLDIVIRVRPNKVLFPLEFRMAKSVKMRKAERHNEARDTSKG